MKNNCLYCGSEFEQNIGKGRKRKFCSNYCRHRYRYERLKNELTDATCKNCRKQLTRKQKKFCSYECFHISQRIVKGTIRVCVVCGSDFEPRVKRYQCCSLECSSIKGGRTKATKPRERIQKDCEICGTQFEYRYFGGANFPKYCEVCKTRIEADRTRRRRWVTKYAALEKIIDLHIYERDNWMCQICGEHVNEHIRWPDPMSSSLDHVVPISKGGEHIENNVQLAHLGCNSRKWNNL